MFAVLDEERSGIVLFWQGRKKPLASRFSVAVSRDALPCSTPWKYLIETLPT